MKQRKIKAQGAHRNTKNLEGENKVRRDQRPKPLTKLSMKTCMISHIEYHPNCTCFFYQIGVVSLVPSKILKYALSPINVRYISNIVFRVMITFEANAAVHRQTSLARLEAILMYL